ncbi:hypothetical protein GBP66_19095, partial [Mycobacterium avium subsp. hominissuis]|nr:hypothetical protein [Mycobacterium avium subsp. hominissuis]
MLRDFCELPGWSRRHGRAGRLVPSTRCRYSATEILRTGRRQTRPAGYMDLTGYEGDAMPTGYESTPHGEEAV